MQIRKNKPDGWILDQRRRRWTLRAFFLIAQIFQRARRNLAEVEGTPEHERIGLTRALIHYIFDVAAWADKLSEQFPRLPEVLRGHPHIFGADVLGVGQFMSMPQIQTLVEPASVAIHHLDLPPWAGDVFPICTWS